MQLADAEAKSMAGAEELETLSAQAGQANAEADAAAAQLAELESTKAMPPTQKPLLHRNNWSRLKQRRLNWKARLPRLLLRLPIWNHVPVIQVSYKLNLIRRKKHCSWLSQNWVEAISL